MKRLFFAFFAFLGFIGSMGAAVVALCADSAGEKLAKRGICAVGARNSKHSANKNRIMGILWVGIYAQDTIKKLHTSNPLLLLSQLIQKSVENLRLCYTQLPYVYVLLLKICVNATQ